VSLLVAPPTYEHSASSDWLFLAAGTRRLDLCVKYNVGIGTPVPYGERALKGIHAVSVGAFRPSSQIGLFDHHSVNDNRSGPDRLLRDEKYLPDCADTPQGQRAQVALGDVVRYCYLVSRTRDTDLLEGIVGAEDETPSTEHEGSRQAYPRRKP
jgi:hypothetical protein